MKHTLRLPVRRLCRFFALQILVLLSLLSLYTPGAVAQLEGRIAAEPIAIGYVRNLTPPKMFSYARSLAERLEVAARLFEEVPTEELEKMASQVDEPVNGVAWYMVQGLLPSFESITFQQVVDETDAQRLLKVREEQFGSNAVVESKGNGCYLQSTSWSWKHELPPGQDENTYAQGRPSQRGFTFSSKVIEEDGKRFVEQSQTMTMIYRFHDGFLFQANFEELWEMSLPTADVLTRDVRREHDLGLQAYLNRIPAGIRQLGWNMLNSGVSTQIQQRDGEDQNLYQMRRSSADLALPLIKAALFDIDETKGWISFASAQDGAVRGQLTVHARDNSALTRTLEGISAGRSRFAPVLRDDAAATVHLCVQLPEELPTLLKATGLWFGQLIAHETNQQAEMVRAAQELSGMLDGLAEHRTLELLLKLGWTEASAGVIYGGMQVDADSSLIRSLHDLIVHGPNVPPEVVQSVSIIELDGKPAIRIHLPEEATSELVESSSLRITDLYLAHWNSCLWFCAGGENSHEILRQCAVRCQDANYGSRTPLLSAKVDFQKWLSYPQDDPTGIAGWLNWMDHNAAWFPPTPMMMYTSSKPTPLLKKVFDLGGDQDAGFQVTADTSGLIINASIGEAFANYMLMRMISGQDAMMQEQRQRAAEAQKAAAEAAADIIEATTE